MKWLHIVVVTTMLSGPQVLRAQASDPSPKATSIEKSSDEKKATVAKDELWKKLSSDPSVIGVGVGNAHSSSEPVVYVYVKPDASKQTLDRIPKKCHGVAVSVLKSDPFKAQ
jgi:hypothetical protein